MPIVLAVFYGLGVIGLVWFAIDSSRIPAMVWFWSGYSRLGWWATMATGLVALGFPALIAAFVWRFGETRRALLQEVAELKGSAARRYRLDRSTHHIA
jgi:hypothetical protein